MRSEVPAWKWLINRTLTMPDRISLITTIFSDRNQVDVVRNLSRDDAQSFIDVVDEVSTCARGKGWLTPTETPTPCQLGIGQHRATDSQEVPALSV